MQKQNFFQVKASQIEATLGTEWNFLKNKSAEVPANLLFHADRRGWFDMFITIFMAFLGLALGGMLLFVQFNSSLSLDYWLLAIIILAVLWSIWKFWQIQFHLFGKIPRKRAGFWLNEDYLVQVRNKRIIKVFPKKAIKKIEVSYKRVKNANEGYNDKYMLKIYPKFESKAYRYKLFSNGDFLVQMLRQGNLHVHYMKRV